MRWRSAALAVTASVLLAACTSGNAATGGNTPTPVLSTSDNVVTPTPTESTTTAPTPTPTPSVPPSSAPATTSAAPSPTPTVAQTTCKKVTVRVIPGGASPGEEIAAVQFVNSGVRTCTIAGYPTVTLLRNGSQIGQPSQPSTTKPSARTLRPGDVAESLLHDYTQTCQAPLSDSVKVRVPGTSITYVRPQMQLRACVLRVDRLAAPD